MTGTNVRWREGAAWVALAVAFSPAWIEWAHQLDQTRADRYVFVPFAALACLVWHERLRPPAHSRARVAVLTGLVAAALLLFGIAGNSSLLSRLSIPVGALGLAAWLGRPRPAALALAIALVPVPGTVLEFTSPGLESHLAALAVALVSSLGGDVSAAGPLLRSPNGDPLQLISHDAGIQLALTLAALGWASALWHEASPRAAASRALRFSAVAVVAQPAAMVAAATLVAAGAPEAARAVLSAGVFVLAALGAVIYTAGRSPAMRSSTART